MANINDILVQASELQSGIDRLLRSSTYRQYDDLSGLEINQQDSEQLFLLDELRGIMEKLDDVEEAIRYLELPVDEISHLHKNDSDRYETAQGQVFCYGHAIEALITDDRHDVPYWTRTRVEHDGAGYYLVGHRDTSLNGLVIRTRKNKISIY